MWTITGPFDTEPGADLSFQKAKLLKTGKSYPLGRKERPLCVGSKKVSHDHCEFIVGTYSLDDVHDPDKRPSLTFVNKKDKPMRLTRGSSQLFANPSASTELQDGDVISIVTGLPLTVKWLNVCCYSPNLRGKSNVSLETCSSLGISIVYTSSPQVTHHIIPTYIANASIAASLISAAQFVRLEWLSDIMKNADSLEETFILSPINKYRPTFSPSLSPSQKVFKAWEPNEERLSMFAGYRFLVFGEKVRDIESDLRELIKRGGGFLETFDAAGGVAKLHKALTRGQAKESQELVVVADAKAMKAVVGLDEWKKLLSEIKSFELYVTPPELVVQAVLDVETSLLTTPQPDTVDVDNQGSDITSLPDCVPNSIPDEPSALPEAAGPPRKRLLRRANSRQPSAEPAPQPVTELEHETESRKLLPHRTKAVEANGGSGHVNATEAVPPTPNRPRLKRRLGGTAVPEASSSNQAASQLPEVSKTIDEPPLKKFRALFEASDPARNSVNTLDENLFVGEDGISQTQTQTQGFVRRAATGSSLRVLREEEEESQISSRETQPRGEKRALSSIEEDEEMGEVEESVRPVAKRQAIQDVNSVEPTEAPQGVGDAAPSKNGNRKKNAGAPVGRPDTDAEFLKAVAKKGKRMEDNFDREFNNLRISKPDVQRQEPEDEWKLLSDFGDDTGLRGNFMVVMEMDVLQKSDLQHQAKTNELPAQWADKPNFKKFKKRSQGTRGTLVELVVSEENSYETHWRNKKLKKRPTASQSQMQIKSESQPVPLQSKSQTTIDDDEDEENRPPSLGKTRSTQSVNAPSKAGSKPPSRAVSKTPSIAGTVGSVRRTASRSSKQALFLDSDDDIQEVDEIVEDNQNGIEEDDEEQTLRSSGTFKSSNPTERQKRTTGGRGKKAPVVMDDDSDDGAVFKGFRSRRKAR